VREYLARPNLVRCFLAPTSGERQADEANLFYLFFVVPG
jgi:hypothetical protein